MSYQGDIRLGDTLDFKFTTTQATGAGFTLAGSPVLSAYPANSTTQLTAGITLTVDFDSVTGLNHCRIVATGGNGYLTATDYDIVITTGSINSVSAVGYVVGSFSIEHRSAVMPTTAARTLDVSATGEAGVDWANVGAPTTTLALTGTTVASLTNAPTAGDLTATMKTSVATAALTTAMTESYAADGATNTLAQAIYMMLARLTEFSISGTTITIKKIDGSTTAGTLTLNDATNPTSSTRAT